MTKSELTFQLNEMRKPTPKLLAAIKLYTCGWHYWLSFHFTVQGEKAITKLPKQVLVQMEMNDA